jgi:hypothetical protein
MRVAHHIIVVVLVCSLGGLALAGALAVGYRDLDMQTSDLGQNSAALRDISHLETMIAQWLVTVDLVLYEGETYLANGARDQSSSLLALFDGLVEQAANLDGIDRDSRLSALASLVDENSGGLIEALDTTAIDMRERSERLTGGLEAQRQRLGWMAIALSLGYILCVFAVWRWASLTVVRPLARLTEAARDGEIGGAPIHDQARGSSEVRQLAASIHSYAEKLTASAKKVEESNQELNETLETL